MTGDNGVKDDGSEDQELLPQSQITTITQLLEAHPNENLVLSDDLGNWVIACEGMVMARIGVTKSYLCAKGVSSITYFMENGHTFDLRYNYTDNNIVIQSSAPYGVTFKYKKFSWQSK